MVGALNAIADQSGTTPVAANGNGALAPSYMPGVDPTLLALMNSGTGSAPMSPIAQSLYDTSRALIGDPNDTVGALNTNQSKYDKASQAKYAAIQRGIQNLTQLQANQTSNLPLMAGAAGALQPTRTGSIGETIGNALNAALPQIQRQRQIEEQLNSTLTGMNVDAANSQMEGASGQEGFLEKRLSLADQAANQAGQIQARNDLVSARNRAADLSYQGKLATSGMAPFGGMGGVSGVQPNDFATKIAGLENTTGNPGAQNPLSSATGDGQFISGTWLPLIKQVRPDLAAKMTDDQLLALRSDPTLSRQMIVENAKRNSQILDSVGLPSNMTTLALAHRFGPQTAVALLHAPNDAPISSLVSSEVLTANPTLANQTVGQYVDTLQKQAGDTPVSADGGTLSVQTTGDEYLKSLPPTVATTVKALAEGRMAFPSGYALTKPYWQNMLQAVSQYDPNFDAVNYNSRAATRKDFTSGKSAQNITSFNTAIGHLDTLDQSIDGLNNGSMPWVNNISNTISTNMGDTRYQKAAANFSAAKNAVVDELTRAFRGSGGNVHDIESWESSINAADSPAALHQAVQRAVGLLKSRIDAVGEQYNRGMGTTAEPVQLLTPKSQHALARLEPDSGQSATSQTQPNPGNATRINSDADYDKLSPGTYFIGPDGHTRQKP